MAALSAVDLSVAEGEIFGVLGPSGAGKSTLLRCVNLLERPDSGTVRVAGQDLTSLSGAQLRAARARIGMVHQHFALLSARTVAQNIAFPLRIHGVPRREREQRVAELLELTGLVGKEHAYPAQLSGGQKQRVGIARALAGRPRVLLCDEATSALDPETTDSILGLLRDLNQRLGVTVLLITHDMGVVRAICDSVAILADGRVAETGPVAELLRDPDSRLFGSLFPGWTRPAGARETGAGQAETTVALTGPEDGLLSAVAQRFGVDVTVLAGSVQQVAGQRAGWLRLRLTGPGAEQAAGWLATAGETRAHRESA